MLLLKLQSVSRMHTSFGSCMIDCSITTPTAGMDYTTTSGSITFSPTVSQQTILVPIIDDLIPESMRH